MNYEEVLDKLDKTFIGDLELKIALTKAVEKQIAKKPNPLTHIFMADDNTLVQGVECAKCGNDFFCSEKTKYCPFCGQFLEWGVHP